MKTDVGLGLGNVMTYILTALQTNEVYQLIELILSIVTSVVIIAIKVIQWYNSANKDGKITKDEVNELLDDVKDDLPKKK